MLKAPTSPHDRSPFAEGLPDFVEALETLYIKNNLSGRHKFTASWPQAASYVLGEKLLSYDTHGNVDRADRAQEEIQADDRRHHLLELIHAIQQKSVEGGVLQLSYIDGVVRELGREMASLIFSGWVIDKIFPPSPAPMVVEAAPADVDIAPIETPVKTSMPPSPWDLGRKRELFEAKKKGISYRALLAWAEKFFSRSIVENFKRAAH